MTAQLSRWQRPDGFPTDEYFDAVVAALEARGVPLGELISREEDWEFALQIAPEAYADGPMNWVTEDLWVSWRCDELDEPKHADDFTGLGWYWVPYTKPGASGDFAKAFGLPYLEEPEHVAESIADLLNGGSRGR